jgi:hypothetical protein
MVSLSKLRNLGRNAHAILAADLGVMTMARRERILELR